MRDGGKEGGGLLLSLPLPSFLPLVPPGQAPPARGQEGWLSLPRWEKPGGPLVDLILHLGVFRPSGHQWCRHSLPPHSQPLGTHHQVSVPD